MARLSALMAQRLALQLANGVQPSVEHASRHPVCHMTFSGQREKPHSFRDLGSPSTTVIGLAKATGRNPTGGSCECSLFTLSC
jgi:hypothetical protein